MSFELTDEEGEFLVKLAREAVEHYLRSKRILKVPNGAPKKLTEPSGVFVTINNVERGVKELRGCIGHPYPTEPLLKALIDSAVSSAVRDPRFRPLSLKELGHVVFEVSVLTPPELIEVEKPVEYASKIKVGRDGLVVERGYYKGLLLPQVPVEWGWDAEEFLGHCCLKAGLPFDAWLLRGTRVYKFQAIIFEEKEPLGKVERKELS